MPGSRRGPRAPQDASATAAFLLPKRSGDSLPPDFSKHAKTLVEQYRIEDGINRLRVRSSSPLVGKPRLEVDLKEHADLALVAMGLI